MCFRQFTKIQFQTQTVFSLFWYMNVFVWELRELPVLTALTSLTLMTVDRSSSLTGPWLAPSQHKLNEGLLLPFRLFLHWAVICETVSVFCYCMVCMNFPLREIFPPPSFWHFLALTTVSTLLFKQQLLNCLHYFDVFVHTFGLVKTGHLTFISLFTSELWPRLWLKLALVCLDTM